MANTYTQLHVHCVFTPKYRAALLADEWSDRMRAYMSMVVQGQQNKMLAINNMPDHLHMLIGLNVKTAVSDLMREVKSGVSEWINKEGLTPQRFEWQRGYAAFSVSHRGIDAVCRYIERQQEHHRALTFREEYLMMLRQAGIDYDERYRFHDPL